MIRHAFQLGKNNFIWKKKITCPKNTYGWFDEIFFSRIYWQQRRTDSKLWVAINKATLSPFFIRFKTAKVASWKFLSVWIFVGCMGDGWFCNWANFFSLIK